MSNEWKIDLERLNAFCQQNTEIDFRTVDLSGFSNADSVQWAGFENDKEKLLDLLKIYQRMLWIVPIKRDYLAIKLLENGFSSPIKVAITPRQEFIENSADMFGDSDEIAEKIHTQAVKLVKKLTRLQQERDPQSDASPISEAPNLSDLEVFLKNNKDVDFRTENFLSATNLAKFQWTGLEAEKELLVEQLKAYQRMLRVVPPDREELAKKLLKNGIQSSLQITSIPKKVFIQDNLSLFDNDPESAEQVYMRALALRKAVALQYVARVQQAEPAVRASSAIR